ncbi:acyl carrier protein [Nonlabens dokdonensis]|mgnify:CR=1 FL=1|uniref:Acyl carrier protein n=1 Tax=Nonlabens dokdonensis TaxID=328515 RepID=A0A1Z8APD4_9FLAO|nr:acyl carrier protein [Nonlabens dokdonensis]OUS12184.1 acyl carrier protein [Nonlabens dokdonensis]
MNIDDFINNFAEQFDETEKSEFLQETTFRDLDEWDSMIALSIIGMVDEEYDIELTGDEIRAANTISDLFKIVSNKK